MFIYPENLKAKPKLWLWQLRDISIIGICLILSALVFGVFGRFVFGRLVRKHTARILGCQNQPQFFLRFFDRKAFLIMAVMMTGGIAIRRLELAPQGFIAVFYTGLGASLLLAGLLFGCNYGKALLAADTENREA